MNSVYSMRRIPEKKGLDKRKFKLRWLQASDHRAFNNIENVWANSCHGLPEQSDKKETLFRDYTASEARNDLKLVWIGAGLILITHTKKYQRKCEKKKLQVSFWL